MVWYGWYDMAWYGMVWHGMVWYGMYVLKIGFRAFTPKNAKMTESVSLDVWFQLMVHLRTILARPPERAAPPSAHFCRIATTFSKYVQ